MDNIFKNIEEEPKGQAFKGNCEIAYLPPCLRIVAILPSKCFASVTTV